MSDLERGRRRGDFSGIDLSDVGLIEVLEGGGVLAEIVEHRLELAKEEADRIRGTWKAAADRIQSQIAAGLEVLPADLRRLSNLNRRIKTDHPGVTARKTLYRNVGSLPRGWMSEVFGPAQSAK